MFRAFWGLRNSVLVFGFRVEVYVSLGLTFFQPDCGVSLPLSLSLSLSLSVSVSGLGFKLSSLLSERYSW